MPDFNKIYTTVNDSRIYSGVCNDGSTQSCTRGQYIRNMRYKSNKSNILQPRKNYKNVGMHILVPNSRSIDTAAHSVEPLNTTSEKQTKFFLQPRRMLNLTKVREQIDKETGMIHLGISSEVSTTPAPQTKMIHTK